MTVDLGILGVSSCGGVLPLIEKICSHCGATLLLGLRYCPGCLREIETRRVENLVISPADLDAETDAAPARRIGSDSMLPDLEVSLARAFYPLRSTLCLWFGRPLPEAPPAIAASAPQDSAVFSAPEPHKLATMALSGSYTRVVCPKCLNAQRASIEVSPADVLTCRVCNHEFPGSFAAEFRKGADLECARCGVATFCVSGLAVTTCPNCKFSTQRVTARTRIKPKVLASIVALGLLGAFGHAIATQTTTQFIVAVCVICVGSAIGFVTMCALGF